MLHKPLILSLFPNSLNKINKTWALMEDPLFNMIRTCYKFTDQAMGRRQRKLNYMKVRIQLT